MGKKYFPGEDDLSVLEVSIHQMGTMQSLKAGINGYLEIYKRRYLLIIPRQHFVEALSQALPV